MGDFRGGYIGYPVSHLVEPEGGHAQHLAHEYVVPLDDEEYQYAGAEDPFAKPEKLLEVLPLESEAGVVMMNQVGYGAAHGVASQQAVDERPDVLQDERACNGHGEIGHRPAELVYELFVELQLLLEKNDADVGEPPEQHGYRYDPNYGERAGTFKKHCNVGRQHEEEGEQCYAADDVHRPRGIQVFFYVIFSLNQGLVEPGLREALQDGHG